VCRNTSAIEPGHVHNFVALHQKKQLPAVVT
jgi:hypothetical protein